MFINKLLIVLTPNLPLTPVAIVVQKKTDHSRSDEARNIGYLKRTTFFQEIISTFVGILDIS